MSTIITLIISIFISMFSTHKMEAGPFDFLFCRSGSTKYVAKPIVSTKRSTQVTYVQKFVEEENPLIKIHQKFRYGRDAVDVIFGQWEKVDPKIYRFVLNKYGKQYNFHDLLFCIFYRYAEFKLAKQDALKEADDWYQKEFNKIDKKYCGDKKKAHLYGLDKQFLWQKKGPILMEFHHSYNLDQVRELKISSESVFEMLEKSKFDWSDFRAIGLSLINKKGSMLESARYFKVNGGRND